MPRIYHSRFVRQTRRALRRAVIDSENILWEQLRGRRLGGLKFRRQYSIGRYIVDFYCPKLRLGIELDGNSHRRAKTKVYDYQRQKEIEAYGISILRFTNEELSQDLDKVLARILEFSQKHLTSNSSPHLRRGEIN